MQRKCNFKQERKASMHDTHSRLAGHGVVHAMGIWLATIDYALKVTEPDAIAGTVRVTNGERDLTPGSLFADELVLELEDGMWSPLVPISGNAMRGFYHVRLDGVLQPPPVPRTVTIEPAA